jgi:hypothetical protein
MKRRIAALAAATALAVGGAAFATSASARDSFAVSIGVPGVALGYSNYGYAPAPAPYYYSYSYAPAPYPYYYGPTVVYRSYPYHRHYYYGPRYHHW